MMNHEPCDLEAFDCHIQDVQSWAGMPGHTGELRKVYWEVFHLRAEVAATKARLAEAEGWIARAVDYMEPYTVGDGPRGYITVQRARYDLSEMKRFLNPQPTAKEATMAKTDPNAPAKTSREKIIEHRMGHLFAKATEYEELAMGELNDAVAHSTWRRLAKFYRDWLKDTKRELEEHRRDPVRFEREREEYVCGLAAVGPIDNIAALNRKEGE